MSKCYTGWDCKYWDGHECREPQVGLCPANTEEDLEAIEQWWQQEREGRALDALMVMALRIPDAGRR